MRLTCRNYTGKLNRQTVQFSTVHHSSPPGDRYKWVALSNTTLGVLLATIDASIMLIAMPAIFRGIGLDPLRPGNSFYLLWMILGFLVVSSVLVVGVGRLGDLYGRVRMYNLGFVIYTVASLLLAIDWMHGRAGADWLIAFRIVQGVGAAFLIGQSAAILTDAFPRNQRGLALGITNVVGISGQFIGLVLGGVLAPIDWRLIFLVSVPFGAFGTVWSYLQAPRDELAGARADRLAREPHVRGRARAGDDRDHLRDPAVRLEPDGLDESVRRRLPEPRSAAARSRSSSSSSASSTRCSGCSCSRSAPSRSASSPASSRRSRAAA